MKSVRFDFFATKEDLLPGIQAFEAEHQVQYVLQGLFHAPIREQYASATAIPDLGRAVYGDRTHENTYLVVLAGVEVRVRPVPQSDGSTRYSIDLMTNPTGFSFRPSGVYGDHCVIDGYAGTATGDEQSVKLCKGFIRRVRKQFTRIQSCYVGPNALRLLHEGYRLTLSIRTPESFDLKLP